MYDNFSVFNKISGIAVSSPILCSKQFSNFPPRRLGFEPRLNHVGFVVDKVALGQVSSEYFVSPANSHSTDWSTFISYHLGLVQ
jgi:hypothetical protein